MFKPKVIKEDKNSRKLSISEKNVDNIMNHAKIKTYKNIGRRSSKYNLLEEAKNYLGHHDSYANKNPKVKELNLNQIDDNSSLNSLTSSEISSTPKKEKKKENLFKQSSISLHKYSENKLPVITNSKQILGEIDNMTKKNNYYMKFVANDNFGAKYARHNPAYQTYDKNNEEEFIQLMGLNDEEKDPLSVINNRALKMNEKIEIKRDNANYLLFKTAKKRINIKENKEKDNYKEKEINIMNYDNLMKNNHKKKFSKKKKEIIFSLMKKDEFSDFLITNYLKVNYPDFLNNSKNGEVLPKVNNIKNKKMKKNKYEKRKIYVIKDSIIISNPSNIPGFFAEIPSIKEMKSFSIQKRMLIMRQFFEFASDKFRTHLSFKYIFCKDRTCLIDFADLPENQKYIFVSSTSIFQGLSIPLNKNIIQLYLKHFTEEETDNFYFNDSSNEDSMENDKSFKKKDDIYDIFLNENKKFENSKIFQKKLKRKKNNQKKLNSSFTFGIEENNYEYIYYSDDEKRKKDFHENHYKYFKNKLDFYIKSQNELFDNRIKELLSKLKTNKDGSIKNIQKYKKFKKTKNELVQCYLTEKNIPKKNMLKNQFENKPLKGQDIIDAFNLLKNKEQSININKFIKVKKSSYSNFPFIIKNIKDNSCKYCYNRKKTDSEYPTILSYNLPMIVETHPKYSLIDLIKYYTKFKSLVNLWFNMHTNADVVQYGIDFETFHRCTEDICDEEEILVKKIYDKINSGTSGVLSLEDYVDALTTMNSNDILDQIEFFMRVFNSKDKDVFNYKDILEICKISIKRLIRSKNNEETENVVLELGNYLAEYIFKICESDKNVGVKIDKLKNILMNDTKNIEYLRLFMCSFGDEKIKKEKKDEETELQKYKKEIKFSIEDELKNIKK